MQNLALLTDFYQLSMSYAYWKHNLHEQESVFHLFFRKNPFKGQFAVCAGLDYVVDFISNFQFSQSDLEYLTSLNMFDVKFIDYLKNLKLYVTVDAIPEGTVVFPNEPLLRITGPILQCQLLETPLLNMINFQTLIATKAARVCKAAEGKKVMEFGLRRAQGIDGALTASRAAYIGGVDSTSNVLAGKRYGIPVIGTHAHSWIMSFESEQKAFAAYAEAMPDNCVFLVDTYDTLTGVKNAIAEGEKLKAKGHKMLGIRLDSGDLVKLSYQAREMLDFAGFGSAMIVASNDLDEYKISQLNASGAKIDAYGVGTNLVTAEDQPALGGVYKLGAIQTSNGWVEKIKLSSDVEKTTIPGILDVKRYVKGNGCFDSDMICANQDGHIMMYNGREYYNSGKPVDLLFTAMINGEDVTSRPSLKSIRSYFQDQMRRFPEDIFSIEKQDWTSEEYPVGIEKELYLTREEMIKNHNEGL